MRCFQLLHYGLMPRVVQDQSHKFETDELFRKLSEDTEVWILFRLKVNLILFEKGVKYDKFTSGIYLVLWTIVHAARNAVMLEECCVEWGMWKNARVGSCSARARGHHQKIAGTAHQTWTARTGLDLAGTSSEIWRHCRSYSRVPYIAGTRSSRWSRSRYTWWGRGGVNVWEVGGTYS